MIVDGIEIQLIRKRIKHLRLVVLPTNGHVRMSVPVHITDKMAQSFLMSKMHWIKNTLARFEGLTPVPKAKFISGETLYLLGKPYRLMVTERPGRHEVVISGSEIILFVKHGTAIENRRKVIDEWYRNELKSLVPGLLKKWEPKIGKQARDWNVKKMKTRWGSCNIHKKRIWLNLELAKKPLECIEYVLVHELVHLLEKNHNSVFYNHLNGFIPDWSTHKAELERTLIDY